MTTFKSLNTAVYKKHTTEFTAENLYWKQLSKPVLVKEFGPIDYIDVLPTATNTFAVTCSLKVQVYNSVTKLPIKAFSRFKKGAYGGVFRYDGKLLCAGSEEKSVKLFDTSTKNLLRVFNGHEEAVHRVFFVGNRPNIVSFSDDKSVKLWDIPTETAVVTYADHQDYIRAGAVNPVVPDIVVSGGYDGFVKMYDTRSQCTVSSMQHGLPIESVLFMPTGGLVISAGGNQIKIWDATSGGKLLGSLVQHHKTVTCLRLATNNTRLLSGSLDRHVKIYDISTFKVVHTIDYPNSILSLGVGTNDNSISAGFVDGLISIARREEPQASTQKKIVSYKYNPNIKNSTNNRSDVHVEEFKPAKQAKYDQHLRKFEFKKALRAVLLPYVATKSPQITVSLLQELLRRRALTKAFTGCDSNTILSLLRFFVKNITDFRFTRVLLDVVNVFMDMYGNNLTGMNPEIVSSFLTLIEVLKEEQELQTNLAKLQGSIQTLLGAGSSEHNSIRNV